MKISVLSRDKKFTKEFLKMVNKNQSLEPNVTFLVTDEIPTEYMDLIVIHSSFTNEWAETISTLNPFLIISEEQDEDLATLCHQNQVTFMTIPYKMNDIWLRLFPTTERFPSKRNIKSWQAWVILWSFIAILASICYLVPLPKELNLHISEKVSTPVKQETLYISVFGENPLSAQPAYIDEKKEKKQDVKTFNLDRKQMMKAQIDKQTNYILLPADSYTEEEINLVKKWVDQKYVVFLYGNPLPQEKIREFFGPYVDIYDVKGTFSIQYALYGFGYSAKNNTQIPYFLLTSADDNNVGDSMKKFLVDKFNEHKK
ncbi:hypothetical protein [Bacillus bombysepticus]|uniref:hypothetical protein n=1 Tax=Bacillus bombysepticus TaxID=658666 RepID=UPI0030165FC5